jgi:hypothetical protein
MKLQPGIPQELIFQISVRGSMKVWKKSLKILNGSLISVRRNLILKLGAIVTGARFFLIAYNVKY